LVLLFGGKKKKKTDAKKKVRGYFEKEGHVIMGKKEKKPAGKTVETHER